MTRNKLWKIENAGRLADVFFTTGKTKGNLRSYMRWNRKTDNTGKLVMGAIAGLAAGFTAGILTAPRTGKELRTIISSRTNDTLRRAREISAENKEKMLESGREKIEETITRLR